MAVLILFIFALYFEFDAILLCNPGADVYSTGQHFQESSIHVPAGIRWHSTTIQEEFHWKHHWQHHWKTAGTITGIKASH